MQQAILPRRKRAALRRNAGLTASSAALLMAGTALGQLDMSSFYTQTVKTGQPWAAIETGIDSVAVGIEVNRGVVTTRMTLAYTPGQGVTSEWRCMPVTTPCADPESTVVTRTDKPTPDTAKSVSDCIPVCKNIVTNNTLNLDSLETTAYFSLKANSVVSDMTLWVGQVPVKAALQERALASAQYESIVKRRRDPALLESWGNGSYNLRIFPGKSGETRRIQIEVVQGLENEGNLLVTVLPLMQSLSKIYATTYTSAEYEALPYRKVGKITVEAVAVDGKTYDLNWPGLGSGQVGAAGLKLTATQVSEIKVGRLSTTAASCSGCLTPWTATREGQGYFGVKANLIAKQLKFSAEPSERLVVLDAVNSAQDPKMIDRARKLALLALKAYAGSPYTGNLVFSDGKGGLHPLFAKSTSFDDNDLRTAYEALRDWTPALNSNATLSLETFAKARGLTADPVVLCLINNDTTPYYNYGGIWNETVQQEAQKFEASQAKKDSALAKTLNDAHAMLFGFWNNYRLNQVATLTGGYQLGTLYNYGIYRYYALPVATVDTALATDNPFVNFQMPALFGAGRYDAYGVVNLKVSAKGKDVSDLVVLPESYGYYGYYRGGPILVDAVALAKGSATSARTAAPSSLAKSASMLPWYPAPRETTTVRIAGQYTGSGHVTLEVTGLWGGLSFSATYEVDLPSLGGADAADARGAGIWALQKGESLALDYLADHVKELQTLGKTYHIVNRQMSLLALEPGMDLWTEMPSKDGTTTTGATTADMAVPSERSATPAGGSVDNVSLESILKDFVPILQGQNLRLAKAGALTAKRTGARLEIAWLADAALTKAEIEIYDMQGHRLLRTQAHREGKALVANLAAPAGNAPLLVRARSGQHVRTLWIGAR